jgi:arylsulfatase
MYVHRELEGQRPLREGTMTIATLARKAATQQVFSASGDYGFPGSSGEPLRQGSTIFYGYICQRLGHNHYPAFLYADNQRVYTNNPLVNTHTVRLGDGQDPLDGQSYASMRLTDYAMTSSTARDGVYR